MKIKKKHTFKKVEDDQFEEVTDYTELAKWYDDLAAPIKESKTVTDDVLIALKDEAKKCLDSEVATYNIKNSKLNTDHRWMKGIMAKGTISDKIAAYTVMIQEKPVYNLDNIRNLISMVKVGKKKECIAIIETLSELFVSDLLKPNQKLKPFYQQPLSQLNELSSGNAITRRKYLSYWYFEDQLKESYTTFIQALNTAAHDTVESNKEKAIAAMSKLLAGNPEQEKNLLTNIINKLGDPSQKVASKAMYCLSQLLHKHSNMQATVLKEVEKMLFRSNVGHKAQYYSLCFLSQFFLNHESQDVARKLIEVYFSFFKKCIKEGDVDSRLMSALLMGVNRAYPYAKLELEKISEHINTMYRVVHVANFNVSLHALTLLYQVSEYSNNVNDRFYSALYKKLLDPALCTTTHQAMILNLIYKSLLRDTEKNRVCAFIKRLLQICMLLQPNFACGVLYLVSHVLSKNKNKLLLTLKRMDYSNDSTHEVVEMKEESESDEDDKEEEEENENSKDEILTNMVYSVDQEEEKPEVEEKPLLEEFKDGKSRPKMSDYDPTYRNPLFCGIEYTAFTELTELKNHFHPSVALFVEKIMKGERIIYNGDPLKDFTLIRFLDRFVFKNPKRQEDLDKQGSHPMFGKRKNYVVKGIRSLPITSKSYLNENQKNIPVDELFMFNYLRQKHKPAEDNDNDESDVDSVCSEEFEDMLDKMSEFQERDEDVDEDIDYMNDVGETMKSKKEKKAAAKRKDDDSGSEDISGDENDFSEDDFDEDEDMSNDDEELSGEEDNEGDDFEMNEEDEELLKDLDDDDDDGSDIMFDSDEDEKPKTKKGNKYAHLKRKADNGSIFASADEFASILEDEGLEKGAGTSQQIANRDKSDIKQLDWEKKRNHWMKGFDHAMGKKGAFKGKKNFSKKRPNKAPFAAKQKRHKRS